MRVVFPETAFRSFADSCSAEAMTYGAVLQGQVFSNSVAVGDGSHINRETHAHQAMASISAAREKSLSVRPPASWVVSMSVTLGQVSRTSGWWLAISARTAALVTKARPS